MKEFAKYRDKYRQVWTLRKHANTWYVWNQYAGNGLWDNGRGLVPL